MLESRESDRDARERSSMYIYFVEYKSHFATAPFQASLNGEERYLLKSFSELVMHLSSRDRVPEARLHFLSKQHSVSHHLSIPYKTS